MTDHTPGPLVILYAVCVVLLFLMYAWTVGAIGHPSGARTAITRVHEVLNGAR